MSNVWERLRQKTPDVTPVTAACRKTYDVTTSTTVHVTRAVTATARDVHECLSDDQRRGDVTRVAKDLSVNGALYLCRSYGGGPIIDIVSRSWHGGKVDSQKEKLKELEVKVAKLEKELNSSRKLSEQTIVPPKIAPSKSKDESSQPCAGTNQGPKTVLRNIMMQRFVSSKL
ncbi:hypothetical protein RND81_10G128600 [Saponaria officinalis]|uniref:Uncharacterized protein n=1 Tax=Saponaria officinalis TaxID=3572 RepID=A0AAW1I2D3_SAPOF